MATIDVVHASVTDYNEYDPDTFIIGRVAALPIAKLKRLKEQVTFSGGYTEDHVAKIAKIMESSLDELCQIHDQIGLLKNATEMIYMRAYTSKYYIDNKFMNSSFVSNVEAMITLKA